MQILFSVIGGAVTALTIACRALLAIGLRRASVQAIRLATISATVTGSWRTAWDFFYRNTTIIIKQEAKMNHIAKGAVEYSISLIDKLTGKEINYGTVMLYANELRSIDLFHKCMVTLHVGKQPVLTPSGWVSGGASTLNPIVRNFQTQALKKLDGLVKGIPAALAAFFLNPDNVSADECLELLGEGTHGISVHVTARAGIKAVFTQGSWQANITNVTYELSVPSAGSIDIDLYAEIISWLATLNPAEVAAQVQPQPVLDWQEDLTAVEQQLNSATASNGFSIAKNGGLQTSNSGNLNILPPVANSFAYKSFGDVVLDSGIEVVPSLPCPPSVESCEGGCGCENPPLKKYKVTSVNFGEITYPGPFSCFGSGADWVYEQSSIINGVTVTLSWRSCDGSDPLWFVFAIGGEPFPQCYNLIAAIFEADPTGTHQFFGCTGECDACDNWTVTIEEDLSE